MATLYVEGGNWGQDEDHTRWCREAQRRPWRARCPICKGKGKVPFTFGSCTTCDGRRTVLACKDHEIWWVRG